MRLQPEQNHGRITSGFAVRQRMIHDMRMRKLSEKTQTTAVALTTIYFIAVSTMSISCSVVPPLTPTPATTSPSLARGTPPPIAE